MGTFTQLKLGAGGWVTGQDQTSDGTKLARTDTNGVYLRTAGATAWVNIVNQTSMAGSGASQGLGAWDAVIAPSNTAIFYMAYDGYMFKSINSGATWTKQTTFTRDAQATDLYANGGDRRLAGQKIAVDPTNSDHVYAGQTDGGLWRTIDGGTTWAQVSTASVPVGTSAGFRFNPGIAGIVFDPNGGSANTRLNVVYVGSYSNGVYKTTNAGTTGTVTWTQIANGTSSPKEVFHAQLDQTTGDVNYSGAYYCTEKHTNSTFTGWRFHGGTWTQIGSNPSHIAVHPLTAGRIVVFQGENGNAGLVSTDGGTTLTAVNPGIGGTRVAADIPWLAYTAEGFLTIGDVRFDLSTSGANEMTVSQGIGWWHTVYPTTNTAFNWNSQSLGLDQMVSNFVLPLPSGDVLFGCSDRPIFRNLNVSSFPSVHYPTDLSATGICDVHSLVKCAGTPNFVATIINTASVEASSYSTDGGLTWSYFPLAPSATSGGVRTTTSVPVNNAPIDHYGGTLAINSGDTTNLLWMTSSQGKLYQTTNRGTSWTDVTPATSPALTGGYTGWGSFAGYNNPTVRVCADEVTPDVFYAFWDGDDNSGMGTTDEIFFKSIDKGATWTNVHGALNVGGHTLNDAKYYVRLKAVPNNAGNLFITAGASLSGLFRSVDGMTTWTEPNTNVSGVNDYCFGYSGTSTPTMYMIGSVSPTGQGIYQSADLGVTWTLLAASTAVLPNDNYQSLWSIGASATTYGLFYVGLSSGGGFIQGDFTNPTTQIVGFSVIHGRGGRHVKMIGY